MFRPCFSTLWLRIAWPFLLFVAAGSVAVTFWQQSSAERRSDAVFVALAHNNAKFFADHRISLTEQTANYVSRILNVQTIIRRGTELLPEPEAPVIEHRSGLLRLRPGQGVVHLGNDLEAIAARVDDLHTLLLVRSTESPFAFLLQPETMWVLAAFWLLSIALAWAITRGVVRPLRLLAARLPHIEHDSEAALPGADRQDEIGQLARAYLATRVQLSEERARREQAERLAILGRMATGLAHEIHNPLSSIQLHSQLIDSASAGEVEIAVRTSMPLLLSEVIKIESLVNQWMFLARPEPPETARHDLRNFVVEALRIHAPLAAHADVKFSLHAPLALVADVDSRRLSQAISNVVINAIQAMPSGGTLHIIGESDSAGVRLLFGDNGRGFSASALARHAELFFSEKEGGMGIGLNVSAEIVRAHRGSLTVANAPMGGAVVTLSFPPV